MITALDEKSQLLLDLENMAAEADRISGQAIEVIHKMLAERGRYRRLLQKCHDYLDHPDQSDNRAWELMGEIEAELKRRG
jgi:hypothetical protein